MIQPYLLQALGLCFLPVAFSAPQIPADFDKYVIPLPPGVSGTFGRTVIGDLNDDQLPDGVVMVGTTPVLVVAPGALSSTVLPFADVTDVAILPGPAQDIEGMLVSVDAVGLKGWPYNYNPDLRYAFTMQVLNSTEWAGATRVRHANLGGLYGGTSGDIIGVKADGVTIIGMVSGSGGTFTPSLGFQAPAPVRDLGTLQWDGDPEAEIWLHSGINVEVYDQSGVRIFFQRTFAPGDAAVALKRTAPLRDGLALVTKATATSQNQVLAVFGSNGYEYPAAQLGTLGVVALAASDMDDDGDNDLVMSHTSAHTLKRVEDVYTVENPHTFATLPGTNALDPAFVGNVITWTSGPDPSNQATPGWADLDGDVVPDLLFPKQSLSALLSLPGSEVPLPDPPLPGVFEFDNDQPGHPCFRSMYYDSDCVGSNGRLILQLDNAWGVPVTSGTDLEVIIWQKATGAPWPIPQAIRHYVYDLENYADTDVAPFSNGEGDFLIPALLPETGHAFQTIYFLLVRVLQNGTPLRSYCCGVTADFYGQGSCQYLVDLPGAWPASIPWDFTACFLGIDKQQRGGAIPLPRIPDFEPGQGPFVPGATGEPPPVQ